MPRDLSHIGGWHDCPERHAMAATFPNFRDVAPHLMIATEPSKPILLYRAWYDVLKAYPQYKAQEIGDCVSHGHAHANDLLQAVELCLRPSEQSSYAETDTEFIYGESRKVGHMLGWSDGSYGAAAVKAMITVGTVSRAMLGTDGAYSGQRAKSWGLHGPPANVEQMAAPFRLGAVAKISDWPSLVSALWNGYPVTICSNQGFTMTRDRQGFCAARGAWGHCMFISAVRFDRPGACICQSWGPETPDGPTDLDQPHFSFWADRRTVERILGQDDSWMLCRAPDYRGSKLPPAWRGA